MSYILEALKKAQAERQLGSAPTIHAPAANAAPVAGPNRKPLAIGLAAGVVLAAAALMLWRHQDAPAPRAQVASAQTAAPASPLPVVAPRESTPAAPQPVVASHEAAPAAANQPGQVALVGRPDPKPVEREPVAVAKAAVPAPAPTPARVASAPAPVAAAAPAPASPEESLPAFGALPEAVRGGIPKVAFGGYMYSPNPSDRLILIDNVLRHEGEEVAPGLVLEKLLPKGAVMNFRGTRYRVPF
jgi:general secretion pathway protein B